jgi:hypothetical protein
MAVPGKDAQGVLEYWRKRNSKSQITNIKQITMTNPPAADQTCFGHLVLEFEICLEFDAWSLGFHRLHHPITPLLL